MVDRRLPGRVLSLLQATPGSACVSAASGWELATKNYLGKLPGVEILLEQFEMRMADDGITLLDITLRHSIAAGQLRESHKDPFDRILAAQALPGSLTLLSNDTALDTFGVHRIW